MDGPSRMTRHTLEFPSSLPPITGVQFTLASAKSLHDTPIFLYFSLLTISPSSLDFVTVYDCRCRRTSCPPAKDWTLRSRLRTTTLSSTPRTSLTFSDSHIFYGYALSRIIPSGSGLVRIHEDGSLRAGNGSCRVFLRLTAKEEGQCFDFLVPRWRQIGAIIFAPEVATFFRLQSLQHHALLTFRPAQYRHLFIPSRERHRVFSYQLYRSHLPPRLPSHSM
ncbi:hypothetical protein EV421DRAFT_175213 [Armillaria borealis]|uniref:Uncharacterized protein n=1 Tax=Armillaria borealis TaxID=47425 RepID=A0AA39MEI1_9AGAR|nr:hypothetical protein EV421DRAFT_175213 [Armillaria borealis]